MGYRSLRVINEDRVEGGKGFDTHPHRDFEIISYVVNGALEHQDSMGNKAVMRTGDVQRISAGKGIEHSEYNHSPTETVHFLQIWILPSRKGVAPSYAEKSFSDSPPSSMTLACSDDGRAGSIQINQDVDLFIGRLDRNEKVNHPLRPGRYAWIQLIEGGLELNGKMLTPGDGASVADEKELHLESANGAHFLLFDLS
jgi:redox-sensitive bicupin YhaK (pirin superfamily)